MHYSSVYLAVTHLYGLLDKLPWAYPMKSGLLRPYRWYIYAKRVRTGVRTWREHSATTRKMIIRIVSQMLFNVTRFARGRGGGKNSRPMQENLQIKQMR